MNMQRNRTRMNKDNNVDGVFVSSLPQSHMNDQSSGQTSSAGKSVRVDMLKLEKNLTDLDCLASLMDCDKTEEPPENVLHQVIAMFQMRMTPQHS